MAIDNLKGYFEEHDDKNNIVGKAKNNKYLTIIFTSEYQKLMYKEFNKNYVKIKFESHDNVPLNILVNIRTLVLVVRYQRVYINTCYYDSAIKEHLLFCNHKPDFEDFSILATNNNDFKVTLMESLLINRDHPPLNKNKQSLPLELFDS